MLRFLILFCISTPLLAESVSISWGDNGESRPMFFVKDGLIPEPVKNSGIEKQVPQYRTSTETLEKTPKNIEQYATIYAGCISDTQCLDDFKIGRVEVTNKDFRRYKKSHNSGTNRNADSQPAVNVTLEEVEGYIEWLNTHDKRTYSLPTAAQWLYIANASENATSCSHANLLECNINTSNNVASYQPNDWGLYDFYGNVAELVNEGAVVVARGGSFLDQDVSKTEVTTTAKNIGFRLVINN